MAEKEKAVDAMLDISGVGGRDLGDAGVPRIAEQRGASNLGREADVLEEEPEPSTAF